ncbi:hypothetical protein GCM10027598_72150 [Amycolatopsis oliviviridis]|uniref:Uncharacterized protein n=1 Tax=Amycolatopsis oliviviridis TaxID=1471590 RepID=A0ABQ3L7F5_9PSEU|nr:hypothetical protein GCM10017790_02090 [Amycolatopsis oliviviridis]
MRVKAPFTRLSRGNSTFTPPPKYMKAPLLAIGASKGAFMYSKQASAGAEWVKGVVSGKWG